MSNHRPPTDPGASIPSILTGVAAILATLAFVGYILWGDPLDSRHLVGAALGFILAAGFLGQTVARISDRLTARDRIRAYHRRNRMEAERLARVAKRAEEPDPAIVDHWASGGERPEGYRPPVAVHSQFEEEHGYDPGPTRLSPAGWPVPIVQSNPAPEYPAVDTGVIERPDYLIRAAEATLADQGRTETWRTDETHVRPIRADQVERALRPEVGEETRRITYGPSPAALRPIGVPVFRTEADRAAWAHEGTDDDQS
jgi:hypothetical protein